VLVVADHGFIYNDKLSGEIDKNPSSGLEIEERDPRFEIVKKLGNPEFGYCIPLKDVSKFGDDRHVVISAGINRFKSTGSGYLYVHGGASLQEIVVPVIESERKRIDVKTRVEPVLINKDLKVVANILRVQIVQKDPVSRNRKERYLLVGLYEGNRPVSNTAEIVMASPSELPSERNYNIDLVLKTDKEYAEVLKLRVYDKEDMLNPIIEENVINATLIKRDF